MSTTLQLTIKNQMAEVERLNNAFVQFAQQNSLPPRTANAVNLAIEEIVTNTICYGFEDNDEHEIAVSLELRNGMVETTITDDAAAFDPISAPKPHLDRGLDDALPGGLGIHLIRGLMDRLEYRREAGRNVLTLYKSI